MSLPDDIGHQSEETSLLVTEHFEGTAHNGENASWAERVPYRKLVLASFASISLFTLGILDLEVMRNRHANGSQG